MPYTGLEKKINMFNSCSWIGEQRREIILDNYRYVFKETILFSKNILFQYLVINLDLLYFD